ncbi:hypothetical protein [Sphingomonas sp.]|uniref:hypothetical protein n=1 Tax=Sphingomonas sp. TaxID=28214 RepID=UPI002DD67516|nr:hypothetical protein [Sphingomonas sp.]
MPRILLALMCALLAVSVGTTSTAHAIESQVCVEQVNGDHATHVSDAGGAPDKSSKAVPDHQVNCHGHQVAAMGNGDRFQQPSGLDIAPTAKRAKALLSALTDPGLRPPQA